jgi:hypothetical protein
MEVRKKFNAYPQNSAKQERLSANLNVKLIGRLIASDLRRFPAHDLISLHHEIQRQ